MTTNMICEKCGKTFDPESHKICPACEWDWVLSEQVVELEKKVEAEWNNLHHNAKIHTFPEFQNDYEYELFMECLCDERGICISDLVWEIEAEWGYKLKFYQYGRSGATIAPDDWMGECNYGGNGFGGCNFIPYNYSNEDGDLNNRLAVLEHINEYWDKCVENIPTWWKETKEMNEYQKQIDEHDGMVKKNVDIWVKKEA